MQQFYCWALLWIPAALAAVIPASAQAAGQGSWHVELESRADSADKGRVTYRLTAAQGLVQPDSKPALTVSDETLTYASAPGGPRVMVVKFLSCEATFQAPDLTCASVAIRLLPPSDAHEIAVKPSVRFRPDFLAPGFSFQLKVPRGFHYVAGSVHASRMSGLLPTKPPRAFVRPPQYVPIADKDSPHLLSVLLPAPEPRAVGTGFEAPYGIEFALMPD